MLDPALPDLTFPSVHFSQRKSPWNLSALFYLGAARAHPKAAIQAIANNQLGPPLPERIPLLTKIHDEILARIQAGRSLRTAEDTIRRLRHFITWIESTGGVFAIETVEDKYRQWCESKKVQVRKLKYSGSTAYTEALIVSSILTAALELAQPLILTSCISFPKKHRHTDSIAADKQILAETFTFGKLCVQLIEHLDVDAIYGSLPIRIPLPDGKIADEWCWLANPEKVACLKDGYEHKASTATVLKLRAAWEAERSTRTRFPAINLRIALELLVFIAQTGMNLSQAGRLKRYQFSYKSTTDGYEVKDYKHRRHGSVLFEIFSSYKTHFERYLNWCDKIFSSERPQLLFPFIRPHGSSDTTTPGFDRIRYKYCRLTNIRFIAPRELRKTRINWLLRYSNDPALTAEQAQHTKETLLRHYEKPSLQLALSEFTLFWRKNDPRLIAAPVPSVGPGICSGVATAIPDLPNGTPKPDCTHPAGCLFCNQHRDIDTLDYVWSLTSMRHLNVLLLRGSLPANRGIDPVRHVEFTLQALTTKLAWFRASNAKRFAWTEEAANRVEEGEFHPHWRYVIKSAEGL